MEQRIELFMGYKSIEHMAYLVEMFKDEEHGFVCVDYV